MTRAGLPVVALGLYAAATSVSFAESKNLTPTYNACIENSGGATFSMIDCMTAEYEQQDKRLNAAYKAVVKQLEGKRVQELKEAQRAWIKFRDLNCGFLAGGEGQMARIESNSCMLSMTAERADELKGFVLE